MATIEEIRARWQAATPGPWFETDLPDGVLRVAFVPLRDGHVPAVPPMHMEAYSHYVEFPGDMEDYTGADLSTARAIAAAPTDIATLLAALDAVQRQLALADIVMRWVWESGPPDDGETEAAFAAYREARRATND